MQKFVLAGPKFASFNGIFFIESFTLSKRFSVCAKRDADRPAILVVSATNRELGR